MSFHWPKSQAVSSRVLLGLSDLVARMRKKELGVQRITASNLILAPHRRVTSEKHLMSILPWLGKPPEAPLKMRCHISEMGFHESSSLPPSETKATKFQYSYVHIS